jgi:hypothetical protein
MKILISNSLRKKSFSEVNWMFFLSRRGVEGSRKRCCRDAAGQTGFVDFNRRSNATTASRSDQQVAAVAERELWRGTLKFRKKLTSNIGRLAPIHLHSSHSPRSRALSTGQTIGSAHHVATSNTAAAVPEDIMQIHCHKKTPPPFIRNSRRARAGRTSSSSPYKWFCTTSNCG